MDPKNKRMDKFWAGGFLYSPQANSVFLHKRDGNTRFNPNKWAFFGGLNDGPESFVDCFIRELHEEIGLAVQTEDAVLLREYLNTDLNTYRVVFYVETSISKDQLTLGEGAGFDWVPLKRISEFDLTDKTREDIDYFVSVIGRA
jgi:8-oxo-dGTP pyrophosphatase MutT (NUDIX family)